MVPEVYSNKNESEPIGVYGFESSGFVEAKSLNKITDTYATSLTNQAKSIEKEKRAFRQFFDGMEGDKNGS